MIRHRSVGLLLAADRIRGIAEYGHVDSRFSQQFPLDLVQEALAITGNPLALQHLSKWIAQSEHCAIQPMAASLLHAVIPASRPARNAGHV